ncbi:energy transducer TonB [Leptospira sp. GIMC2001]|uniref:energy transducer TonB n=1 Tax=Leptospira sp. GIMC2001 TaxID=1513297 RepID=UPI00234AA861|nr:energy transducer TonB [Leptospira sp. GIMC2001]WCL47696.1 energy transducer TonB [Leptospira sp. GIMC2001]
MNIDWLKIKKEIKIFGVFRFCLLASIFLHVGTYGTYYIATYVSTQESEEVDTSDMEVDFEEIPPELLGGTSSPAPVEKQEWVEGSSKDQDKEAPDDSDINPNALSGDGTDKDGFLYSYNGDRPPTPIIDFDLRDYFPDQAKAASITNKTIVVMVQIDERGQLLGTKVVSGKAGYGFDEAAIKIVRRARFAPGYLDGKPTRMAHRLPINFTLED